MILCNFATYTSCRLFPGHHCFLRFNQWISESINQSRKQAKYPQNSSLDWRGASAVKSACSPFKGPECGPQHCGSCLRTPLTPGSVTLFSPARHCIHVHESTHRHIHINKQKSFSKKKSSSHLQDITVNTSEVWFSHEKLLTVAGTNGPKYSTIHVWDFKKQTTYIVFNELICLVEINRGL